MESVGIKPLDILVTLDENYLPYLNVMLTSLLRSNPDSCFNVYLLHSSIRDEAMENTRRVLGERNRLIPIRAGDLGLEEAPTTSRYPQEIYYRIFAARYLPDTLDRILYLDPDLIINGSVEELCKMPLDDYYFAAASHIGSFLQKVNRARLDMDLESCYINSGVMLMNLRRLREEQDYAEVFNFITKYKNVLFLPDQDIISSLYGTKIHALSSFEYNMTERLFLQHAPFEKDFDLNWVRENSVIIHYCGRNKPWKNNYHGQLDVFYHETLAAMDESLRPDPMP